MSTASQPPPQSASPALADGLALIVTQIYAEAETAILATITIGARAALAARDPRAAITHRSAASQTEIRRILDRMDGRAHRTIPAVLGEAYGRGHGQQTRVLQRALWGVLQRLTTLRGGVIRWVAGLWNRLTVAVHGPNPLQTANQVLQHAAGRGVVAFIDSAGREWALTSYVDQVVQHAAGGSAIDGFLTRVADEGGDLVIVTESAHPCPLCDPWEHRVLSIGGNDPKRPSMAQARRAGLFHPRCHHTVFAWRPGFTWPPHSTVNEPGTYEATQRQRDIERHIREWKRRRAAALDDVTRVRAGVKVRSWQAELRLHLAAEGLRRSRQRERTDYGHTGPLKHAHG